MALASWRACWVLGWGSGGPQEGQEDRDTETDPLRETEATENSERPIERETERAGDKNRGNMTDIKKTEHRKRSRLLTESERDWKFEP